MDACWNCGFSGPWARCLQCGENKIAPQVTAVATVRHASPAPILPAQRAVPPAFAVPGAMGTAPVTALPGHIRAIGNGVVTSRACDILLSSDEAMVWEDSPSAILLADLAFKYLLLLAAVLALAPRWWTVLALLALAAIHLALRYWHLRSTVYRLTSQRLEITAGLLNRCTVAHEVHRLDGMAITSSVWLRRRGRANLAIRSPRIVLRAIRGADRVRDLLRDAGQLEAGRVDKIRWR